MINRPTNGKNVFVAPGAVVVGNVHLGDNVNVWFNAVIRGDEHPVEIGENTNIQDNCVIHQDPWTSVKIGKGVTIGHSAIVHGCTIGDNTLIGMGAIVMNGAVVGNNCIVAAGALVTERTVIPDGSLFMGSPAKFKRPLTDDEIKQNAFTADAYVKSAAIYIDEYKNND